MVKFLDGPAVGEVLQLRRAPLLLRVVRDARGKWDALDQLSDAPDRGETIFVYYVTGKPTDVHINAGRKGSGWYKFAEYRFFEHQPTDHSMRDTAAWRSWPQRVGPSVLQLLASPAGGNH
jgi:hypothetical protein